MNEPRLRSVKGQERYVGKPSSKKLRRRRKRPSELPNIKPIPGFPGFFASDDGRVFGVVDLRKRLNRYGYEVVVVRTKTGNEQASMPVHRAVCLAFNGDPGKLLEVRHLDGNKINNHPSNLAWGTRRDNVEDLKRHGMPGKGERNGNSKLTRTDVNHIRKLYPVVPKPGQRYKRGTLTALARRFGVGVSTIRNVLERKTYVGTKYTK